MPVPSYPYWHYKRHPEIFGFFLGTFIVSQLIALLTFYAGFPTKNALGLFGYCCAHLWFFLFGINAFLALFGGMYIAIRLCTKANIELTRRQWIASILSLFSTCLLSTVLQFLFPKLQAIFLSLFHIPQSFAWQFSLGGFPTTYIYKFLPYANFETLFSSIGTALGASLLFITSIFVVAEISISSLWNEKPNEKISKNTKKEPTLAPALINEKTIPEREVRFSLEEAACTTLKKKASPDPKPILKISTPTQSVYTLPSPDLLHIGKKVDMSELKKELKTKADLLESTLLTFGIEAKVGQIHCGPTITMFEVHPATGVKVGKIKTLEHDIALNMEAQSIRIIAPIPGKAAVGIEVPNQNRQEVSFREIFLSYQQKGTPFKIPMLLGKSVNGELVIADLTKMPHCIIAGATGSGKSVCINSIIMSIIMLMKPDEVKFLMVDPKKVELAPYTELPHMIAPVITEPHTAAAALNWLVKEMEKRYEILRLTGHRNIDSFNSRTKNSAAESEFPISIPEKLPYMVGIIDELADLMMVATQDVEGPIARIAQMARAVGIHLIVATQRPSREVITGLIKANFPARIAFKVASRVNSQIILDDIGAETLLGNGDMLILLPGSSQASRAQGVFVRDEEISHVIQAISSQLPPNYLIGPATSFESMVASSLQSETLDELYETAKKTVLQTGNGSTTFLQRKLKIGYARAASIMDQLEAQGIVGPQDGARPRKINYSNNSHPEDQ